MLDVSIIQKVLRPNDLAFGAMLKLGVLPAYFLLEDMTALKPGDWIIQNAGTSVVAQMVVQFAHLRGLRSISIIRDRETASAIQIKQSLCSIGADLVLTENELPEQIPIISTNPVKLALDSAFGPSARLLLDCLGTAQLSQRTFDEQSALTNWMVQLFNDGTLALPALGLERLEWNAADGIENEVKLLAAVDRAKKAVVGQRKQILMFA